MNVIFPSFIGLMFCMNMYRPFIVNLACKLFKFEPYFNRIFNRLLLIKFVILVNVDIYQMLSFTVTYALKKKNYFSEISYFLIEWAHSMFNKYYLFPIRQPREEDYIALVRRVETRFRNELRRMTGQNLFATTHIEERYGSALVVTGVNLNGELLAAIEASVCIFFFHI